MHSFTKLLSLGAPPVLIGLLVAASIALYRVQALALPIPLSTAVATVMLPFVTAASLRSAQSLTRQPHGSREDAKPVFSWSAVTLMLLLIVYDTVMATLSLTHMLPPSQLNCGLEQRWHQLFSNKNANVVRAIQDRHQCCGFNSPRDRAWPFPDRSHTATACIETFGRRASCRGGWRQDEQVAAGLMLLVALVAFLLKMIIIIASQTNTPALPSLRSFFSRSAPTREGSDERLQRRIQGHAYHDDPIAEHEGEREEESLVDASSDRAGLLDAPMQPSVSHQGSEPWRSG